MRGQPILLTPLVIPNNGAASNSVDLRKTFYRGMTIFGPTALTGTITVQVSYDDAAWCELQSGGADIEVGVSEAVTIDYASWPYIRVATDAVKELAERTFPFWGCEDIS